MNRLLTALVGIPITVAFAFFAPQWLFALVIGAIAAMSLHELFALAASPATGKGQWGVDAFTRNGTAGADAESVRDAMVAA